MTVLEVSGGLLVHSPVDLDPSSLSSLGKPRWVLAPNLLHHLYVGRWLEAGLEGWAARGLPEKRPDLRFAGVIEQGSAPFGDEIVLMPLTCFPFSNEVLVLHKPSRTLVLTDLVFNFPSTAPWLTRTAMRCVGGHPGCKVTLLERVLMHREPARREIGELLEHDFDRVILAHGEVLETGGKAALANAYTWLGL
jgi:hypothetical protein